MSCCYAYRKFGSPSISRFGQRNEMRAFPSRILEFCTKPMQIFQHLSSGRKSQSLRISKRRRKRIAAARILFCTLQGKLSIFIERQRTGEDFRHCPLSGFRHCSFREKLTIMLPSLLKSMICKRLSSQERPWRTTNLTTYVKNWRDLLNPLDWRSPTLLGHSREDNCRRTRSNKLTVLLYKYIAGPASS